MTSTLSTSRRNRLTHVLAASARDPWRAMDRMAAMLLKPLCRFIVRGNAFKPARDRALAKWFVLDHRSAFDRFFFRYCFPVWTAEVYLAEPDPDRREDIKALCMGGTSGVSWAAHYDAMPFDPANEAVGDITMAESTPVFAALEAECRKLADKSAVVVQIGSSSGREVAHYAALFPHITFIGLDIDDHITQRAAHAHKAPNLFFRTGLAHKLDDVLSEFGGDRPLIVFAHGSFNYVQPEHLAQTFTMLAKRPPVVLILTESARFDPRMGDPCPDGMGGTRYRGNFSYTHDYRWYAESSGFRTIDCRLITAHKDPTDPSHHTLNYHYQGSVGMDGARAERAHV